ATRPISASAMSSHAAEPPRFAYQPHIDGLRALAVLGVIAFHFLSQWMPGGFAGVDIFFVISGFVVSASVSHWQGRGMLGFVSHFYARRVQRIVPALLVCLLATSIACVLLVPFAWLSSAIQSSGRHAFFGLSNLYLAFNQENYFAPTAEFNPFLHTWSLGVEEQFYLLFPLLFFAWTRGGHWRTASMVVFAVAAFASLGHAHHFSAVDQTAAFYLTTTRFWELATGVLLFQYLATYRTDVRAAQSMRRWLGAGAWISLAAVIVALFISGADRFPYPSALLPVAGTLGLLAFLQLDPSATALRRILGGHLLVAIGRRSYSLYLWHWPVLVILRWTSGIESTSTMLLAAGLTATLAELSYRYVERPLRYSTRLRAWPAKRVVAGGLIMIVSGWLLSDQWIAARSQLSFSTVSRNASAWYALPVSSSVARPDCSLTEHDASIGATIVSIYARARCDKPAGPERQLFVFGDSHAIAYSTLLSEHVLQSGSSVFLYDNPGCTFLSLQPEREIGACTSQADAVLADIRQRAKPGDVLFLAALRVDRIGTQFATADPEKAFESMHAAGRFDQRAIAESAALARLEPLVASGLRIIIDAPKPVFRAPAFRCADAFNRSNPICAPGLMESRDWLLEYRAPVMQSLQRLSAKLPGVAIWDPFPILCPKSTCTSIDGDGPLFFDGDHLSAHANRLLYPDFAQFLLRP
ncbi:MAG: acyltransferase family protein, partial [Dokdonella sp.]